MRFTTVLALACFLSFQAVAQDDHKARNEALCKFSGGKGITVTYPHSERTRITTLRTTEDLATVHGVNLSVGAYELRPGKNSHNNWVLNRRQQGDAVTIRPVSGETARFPVTCLQYLLRSDRGNVQNEVGLGGVEHAALVGLYGQELRRSSDSVVSYAKR
jgi:hypothetical protein